MFDAHIIIFSCSLLSFCWLISASPHAFLTTRSSSLGASCPNQFICKQMCFFPLHPIVHTTPECIYNGRPLSLSLPVCFRIWKSYMYFQQSRKSSSCSQVYETRTKKTHRHQGKKTSEVWNCAKIYFKRHAVIKLVACTGLHVYWDFSMSVFVRMISNDLFIRKALTEAIPKFLHKASIANW